MSRDKIKELRQRMLEHKVVDDKAVVEITARELQELLDMAEEYLDTPGAWG
jgi:hypothetical protein